MAFSEDVLKRYEAYGWHTQYVDSGEDVVALEKALAAAKAETDRPSFIAVRTIIGWPAPTKQNTGKAHGSALGEDEIRKTKEILGFDPDVHFAVDAEVIAHTREVADRGRAAPRAWQPSFDQWAEQQSRPQGSCSTGCPAGACRPAGPTRCRTFATEKDGKPNVAGHPGGLGQGAVRAGAGAARAVGRLGRPGRVATTPPWRASRASSRPTGRPRSGPGGPYGRTLHFGIREHAMGSIMNGITLHGGTRVYGGTFLVFSDYMRPPVRLAALMKLPTIYVWTHDSIGLGEDGPTHQPIEQLAALRAIPGLDVVRPADANETAVVWRQVLENTDRPAGLALSRQASAGARPGQGGRRRQGRLRPGRGILRRSAEVILIATGSEVSLALTARERLEADGTPTRVVSMPCLEWFYAQDRLLPAAGAAAGGQGPGQRRGRRAAWAGARSSARPARSWPSTTSAPAPPPACCSSSSASPPTGSSRRRTPAWSGPASSPAPPPATESDYRDSPYSQKGNPS